MNCVHLPLAPFDIHWTQIKPYFTHVISYEFYFFAQRSKGRVDNDHVIVSLGDYEHSLELQCILRD